MAPVDAAARVRQILQEVTGVTERRMFGGIAFMLNGNMVCAVGKDHLMVRVGPDGYDDALHLPHAHEMRFTGRPMRGYVTVEAAGYGSRRALESWLRKALAHVSTLPPK